MKKINIPAERGFSIVELAFALLVIGAVLAVLWQKVGSVYRSFDVTQASQELETIMQAIRRLPSGQDPSDNDNLELTGLSPELIGTFQGKKIIHNPWHGLARIFVGNAMGWGIDSRDPEYTIRMDDVPSAACTELVMRNADSKDRNERMVAAYISPSPYQGKILCFKTDNFCVNKVDALNEEMVSHMCSEHNRVTVMFSYSPG